MCCKKRTDTCRTTPRENQASEAAWLDETGRERYAGLSVFLRQQRRQTSDSRENRKVQETASAETVACWTEIVLDLDRGRHVSPSIHNYICPFVETPYSYIRAVSIDCDSTFMHYCCSLSLAITHASFNTLLATITQVLYTIQPSSSNR